MPQFNISTNLIDTSLNGKISAEDIQGFVTSLNRNTPLVSDAQCFLDNANRCHINVIWMVAHCIEETADGTSAFATQRHNLFGYKAYTSNPNAAEDYSTDCQSIQFYADFINTFYLHQNQAYAWMYGGSPTPEGMNKHYATDPDWANKIVAIMNEFSNFWNVSHSQTSISSDTISQTIPAVHPAHNSYTVVEGDSLSEIARLNGISNWEDLYNWNKAIIGGDPNLIHPGQVLVLSAPNSLSPTTYTVQEGDNLSEIAQKLGINWIALYDRNKGVIGSDANLIHPGQVLVIP